jgi:hypothetical protein
MCHAGVVEFTNGGEPGVKLKAKGHQVVKDPARPERIKTAEAALILGLSVRTVQAMAARGELPGAARIDHQWTFNEAKIREFIADRERETERRTANIRQVLSHRPTACEAPPSEHTIQKRYEEAMAQLLGKTAAKAGRRREKTVKRAPHKKESEGR